MIVKLKILHGTLQKKQGGSAGFDISIRGPTFLMGSADDCSMICRSTSVSPHHCEILVTDTLAVVQDLQSENGTFVNNERVEDMRELRTGDFLRLGRMEFEVLIEETQTQAPPAEKTPHVNPEAERISEELIKADEDARRHRLEDPESLYFDLQAAMAKTAAAKAKQEEAEAQQEQEKAKRGKKRSKKKKPGKLPERPKYIAENTETAAEEMLRRMFG